MIWTVGLSTALTCAAGAGIAALTFGVEWLRRKRATQDNRPELRVWREMIRPAASLLTQYYEAAERAWIAGRRVVLMSEACRLLRTETDIEERALTVERTLRTDAGDLFREVHPTRVLLGGFHLARLWVSALPGIERDTLAQNIIAGVSAASGLDLADLIEQTDPVGVAEMVVSAARKQMPA